MDDRIRDLTQPVEDWVSSEARDLAEAAQRRLDDAKRDAATYGAAATEHIQHGMEQAREYAEESLRRARDTMARYRGRGAHVVTRDLPAYVREQPTTALLVAAGIGLGLGWLIAGGRR